MTPTMLTTYPTEFRTQAGATLWMTAEQAERWNCGDSTDDDFQSITAVVPTSSRGLPTSDDLPLAIVEQRFPEWYRSFIDGQNVDITARGKELIEIQE